MAGLPRTGEMLLSIGCRSWFRTVVLTGEAAGKASSAGLRGVRTRLGDPIGLAGRNCGEYRIWPDPLRPGIDCVRDMAGARLATDRERECAPERGDAVRERWGIAADKGPHIGEIGEEGFESTPRLIVEAGFLEVSSSSTEGMCGLFRRSDGRGEERNASIRSVSGTGSISAVQVKLHTGETRSRAQADGTVWCGEVSSVCTTEPLD